MHSNDVKIAPSILAADFARLGEQVDEAVKGGADRIHVDVMDGHFVPNISVGPVVVHSLRPLVKVPLEAHLMITDPDRYLDAFVAAGADTILVHVENAANLHRTIHAIKAHGKKAGVVLNPMTPASSLEEAVRDVDLILVMTVNPGFGGQSFIATTLRKIRQLRDLIDKVNPACELEVDGGIDTTTTPLVVEAGARVLVAGSSVFGESVGIAQAIAQLQASAAKVLLP